ncbi:tripartite tricarboxylate transporter substrate-binding protein [Paracoccus sp. MBLB3053]|uniref:Tripartite tricarboxylate transporter substrate-binding protein n=1 Tax=Paracoccus aurantius TaxID=3073814 RepID=A0ABU2HWN1_9RHOB|nr:tripartite tricarboxylate transporter substrate-binding protein [Paracoccus sp. MBLB3053]MDS9469157.1 tripartite tricarboxylate transporter substrate-binding protein [Paracoccus sp. MBLB3053]
MRLGRFNADPIAVNVRADAPYADLISLVEAVKADPGSLAASGANRGGLSHLAWVGMLGKVGVDPIKANWVASDGSAPALQQLAAGAIQVVSTSPVEARALVEAGEAKTLALISGERSNLYVMERNQFPIAPVILGLVLGPVLERNFIMSMQISHGNLLGFFQRPVAAGLGALVCFIIAFTLVRALRRKPAMSAGTPTIQKGSN